MLVKCPVCNLQFDCDPGKYLCKCGTTLDIAPDGSATVVISDSFTHRMLDVASRESTTANTTGKRGKKAFRMFLRTVRFIFFVAVAILILCCLVDMMEKRKFQEKLSAAHNGDASAQYELAHAYETGSGVKKNLPEAIKWYRKAANNGDVLSALRLFEIYQGGIGVKRDPEEAKKWRLYAIYLSEREKRLREERQR